MNLLAIIIVVLALAAAGAIIYVAWELSSDKPPMTKSGPSAGNGADIKHNSTGDREPPRR